MLIIKSKILKLINEYQKVVSIKIFRNKDLNYLNDSKIGMLLKR